MSKKSRKQFLVLGLGLFGTSVAKTLHEKGHEVMVVDNNAEKINDALDISTHAIRADLGDEDVLSSIGAGDFDVAVVATGKDSETAIMSTMILKELGVRYVIVKAETELQKKALYKIGADRVVFPERDMGRRVAMSLMNDNIFDFMELSSDISIAEIPVREEWVGKSLIETDFRRNYGVNIIAIKDNGDISVSYGGDRIITKNETLIVIGTVPAIESIGNKSR